MKKNRLKTLLFGALFLSGTLFADDSIYDFDTHSLVGIEGGYGALNSEYGTSSNSKTSTTKISHVGLKIGSETENFRLFLSGRYFLATNSKYDYIMSYGVELERMFHVAKRFEIFLGVNGGIANIGYNATGENFTRTISDPYYGGDVGVNILLGDSIDWEIGLRGMSIDATNVRNGKTYQVNAMVSAYTSIIFKWHMN